MKIDKDGKKTPENYQEARSLGFFGYSYVLKRPYMKDEEKEIDKLSFEAEEAQERELVRDAQAAIDRNNQSLEDAKGIVENQVERFEKLLKELRFQNGWSEVQSTIPDSYQFGEHPAPKKTVLQEIQDERIKDHKKRCE